MNLCLDEHFSPEIAVLTRSRGHDIIAVAERPDLRGRSDRAVLAAMLEEQRAIVTRDVGDFRPLIAETVRQGLPTFGLVCVSRRFAPSRAGVGRLIEALDALMSALPATNALNALGGEVWLSHPDELARLLRL